jgi:type IV pilus assembly protein PilE
MQKNKGFTLIELLVVIAIIGILSSVVLASLNSARAKGANASAQSNLANARAQAELFYDSNNGSYAGICGVGATAVNDTTVTGINKMVLAAAHASMTATTTPSINTTATATNSVCNATATAWSATVVLRNQASGTVYCADSTGFSGDVAPALVTALSPNCES